MAILDVIEFHDPTGQVIVQRVPQDGSGEFRLGSQLVVLESQAAVFFRDGKALDVFGAGRHTLSTANIPLLANLISIPFGGKSPFRAEVYFVSLKDFIDQKWGTSEPVVFRDSELGMVRLRAFGTYTFAVADPQQFVNKIVGSQGIYDTNQVADYLRNIIISRLNDTLGKTMTTLLDLPQHYNDLGAAMKANVADDFLNTGLALKQFYITSITPPEDVQKIIDQRSSMGAVGDMNRYLQFQAAQAMGNIGQGGGGSGAAETGAGLGAGAGLGLGMAQIINQGLQGAIHPQSTGATPANAGPASAQAGALMTCPNCQAQIPANSKFCPSCGYNLSQQRTCPQCGQPVAPGAKFCANCVHDMTKQ